MRGNTIRLRLTQSEVAKFADTNVIEEIIEFGGGKKLIYAIESAAEIEVMNARFENGRISIFVPQEVARQWTNSNQTGIKAEQNIGSNKVLRLLIEKDFACLEPREGEDDTDTFPNPLENKKC